MKVYVSGVSTSYNFIYASTNGGAAWMQLTNTAIGNASLSGTLSCSADGQVLVAWVIGPTISTNGGATWTVPPPLPAYNNSGVPQQNVCLSADGREIAVAYHTYDESKPLPINISTDYGVTWRPTSISNFWSAIAMSADGTRMIAGANDNVTGTGPLLTSTDAGMTWTSNNVPLLQWSSVAMSADGAKQSASEDIYLLNNLGGLWTTYSPPQPLIKMSSTGKLSWAVPATNLVLLRSSDLFTWQADTNTPVLNTSNLQEEVYEPMVGTGAFFRLASP
jgi:hypothetical protein